MMNNRGDSTAPSGRPNKPQMFGTNISIRGGVQAFQFRKHDFDLLVGGDNMDMYQQLQGGLRSMRAILPI